jgi:hypothetical protein
MSQRLHPALFEKYCGLPLFFWSVIVAKEAEIGRDPAIMIGFHEARVRVCRITEISQAALRGGVQRSWAVKQCDGKQEEVPSCQ